jgi:uncharacterized protein (TIGR02246 family)
VTDPHPEPRTDPDATERIARLERRLAALEDERDVARVVASYGPLVDAGDADAGAALWEPDGVYDVDGLFMSGGDDIRAMVRSAAHQGWIAAGCAHLVGPPHVRVDGDDAVAVCHSLMVVHEQEGFVVRRATANHWRLRRSPDGWRVLVRTNRVLDGRAESPALLRSGVLGA